MESPISPGGKNGCKVADRMSLFMNSLLSIFSQSEIEMDYANIYLIRVPDKILSFAVI